MNYLKFNNERQVKMENKYEVETEKNDIILEKTSRLQERIKNDLLIEIPTYVIDEIVTGGRKDNVIALVGLAKVNNRITEDEAKLFIKNFNEYLVN